MRTMGPCRQCDLVRRVGVKKTVWGLKPGPLGPGLDMCLFVAITREEPGTIIYIQYVHKNETWKIYTTAEVQRP